MTNIEIITQVKFSLNDMAFLDIIRSSEGGSKMGAFILSSCFIDYLAGFRYGKLATRTDFKNFIKEYLPQYDSDKLYHDLRCQLVHNYTEGGSYAFIHERRDLHLQTTHSNQIFLNLDNFIYDIKNSMLNYFKDMDTKPELQSLAIRRYKLKGILGLRKIELID